MYRMSMILAACALTACVGTQSTLDDAAAPLAVASQNGTAVPVVALSPTDATVVATEEATIIDADEADTGLVCESVKRPGSRIAEEVCYNRDVRAANEEAKEEQIRTWMDAVQRDQETRQMWEEMERQRRSMGRMGQ